MEDAMIVAGIDEAGYGPLLGPLVVGCCAFELDGELALTEAPPCLWKRLSKHVSRKRCRLGRKLHVNDSKQVYSPGIGLGELERSLLCVAMASGMRLGDLSEFLAHVAADAIGELGRQPWYGAGAEERFPFEHEALPLTMFANALRVEMERTATRCVHLRARVLPELQLNAMLAQTRNKAGVLFSVAAGHLDYLMRTYASKGLTIFCDRQGGREHYGSLLRLMFEDWGLEIVKEDAGDCEYWLHPQPVRSALPVRLIFREKCEEASMATAMASMLSKYLRETLMRRFNAFWSQHVPGVAPTAGYYNDGQRFLRDIDVRRREMGIADATLIRSR